MTTRMALWVTLAASVLAAVAVWALVLIAASTPTVIPGHGTYIPGGAPQNQPGLPR
jgi:hypothetical protein